jgi:hypothetical protein
MVLRARHEQGADYRDFFFVALKWNWQRRNSLAYGDRVEEEITLKLSAQGSRSRPVIFYVCRLSPRLVGETSESVWRRLV